MTQTDVPPDAPTQDEFLRPVFERIWLHTVALTVPAEGRDTFAPDDPGTHAGMGTLVLADRPCILTAAHVWHLRLGSRREFGVNWQSDRKGRALATRLITPRTWPRPPDGTWPDHGPDVALLQLSDVDAHDLKVRDKVFYDLAKQRRADTPTSLWTPIGVPQEEQTFHDGYRLLAMHLYPTGQIVKQELDNGFDYIDIRAHFRQPGRPKKSFKGVSGSGLWHFVVRTDERGASVWDGEITLAGVIYWQEPRETDGGSLRAHGLKSIELTRKLSPELDPGLIEVGKRDSE